MAEQDRLDVDNGKYTLILEPGQPFRALRYGEEWMEITAGSNMIIAMMYELIELRERNAKLEAATDEAVTKAAQSMAEKLMPQLKAVVCNELRGRGITLQTAEMLEASGVYGNVVDFIMFYLDEDHDPQRSA